MSAGLAPPSPPLALERLLALLCCPRCRPHEEAALARAGDLLRCSRCGAQFPVVDGIPDFLPAEITGSESPRDGAQLQKWQQRAWHDEHELAEWNIHDPHHAPLKEYCLYRQMGSAADLLPPELRPALTLNICCGSGLEAEFFARRFRGPVIGTDISIGMLRNAQERARRGGYEFAAVCADSENLPFRSASIDAVLVLHGLHHLPDAAQGLDEMARVARRTVLVFEPATSPIRRVMMRVGVVPAVEESGNPADDFSESSGFEQVLRARGFAHVRFRRELWSLMISEIRLLNRGPLLRVARAAFEWLHRGAARRWGTKLSLVAWRDGAAA